MGKVKYVFLSFMAFSIMAKAQNDSYAPKITFKDIVQSQVGVVKKVMDLNKEVKSLEKEVSYLKSQNQRLQQEISMLKSSKSQTKVEKTQKIEVPKDYEELINQAKTWAR